MPAMYFLPKEDITTQELAIITGFISIGLVKNIEQRADEIRGNLPENYPSIRMADRSSNPNKTITVDENIYNSLPFNVKRHFSMY